MNRVFETTPGVAGTKTASPEPSCAPLPLLAEHRLDGPAALSVQALASLGAELAFHALLPRKPGGKPAKW